MVEISYSGLIAYGMLLDVAWIVSNKSWCQIRIGCPFELSMYEPIRDYCEFNAYSTHCVLSKFSNHVHMLVDSYKCSKEIRRWMVAI